MGRAFTYSRWDGSQAGFELTADGLLDQLTDELLYHGDVERALARLARRGPRGPGGQRQAGIDELLRRIRERRAEILAEHDPDGVYGEIRDELERVVGLERSALGANDPRHAELDLLADDLPTRIEQLGRHQFASTEAAEAFSELIDRLRQQALQRILDQTGEGLADPSSASMARTKDMLAALNELLDRHRRGADPQFEQFMERFGDFFPERPANVGELLDVLAARHAAMRSLLDSMTPEQADQLARLYQQMTDDLDLSWQLNELGEHLGALMPGRLGSGQPFAGESPSGFAEAIAAARDLGALDRLEHLLGSARTPAALAEADRDAVGRLLGEDAATDLDRLAQLSDVLEESGLVRREQGRLALTAKGLRRIASRSLRDLFASLAKDRPGDHDVDSLGLGHERTFTTRPYQFGDALSLDVRATIRNALRRQGPGSPLSLRVDDFEIAETELRGRAATVVMLDLSQSMVLRGNFLPAKKVAMALHSLISTSAPRDYLAVVGFASSAVEIPAAELPALGWDERYGTNLEHGLAVARRLLAAQSGTKQIIVITDGEPTAHREPGRGVVFHYPPLQATLDAALTEVHRCTRAGIRINSFVLDVNDELRAFVERAASINRGRVFYTTPERLGEYVLVDYLTDRAGRRRARHDDGRGRTRLA